MYSQKSHRSGDILDLNSIFGTISSACKSVPILKFKWFSSSIEKRVRIKPSIYLATLEIKKFGNYVDVQGLNAYMQTKWTNGKNPNKNIEIAF